MAARHAARIRRGGFSGLICLLAVAVLALVLQVVKHAPASVGWTRSSRKTGLGNAIEKLGQGSSIVGERLRRGGALLGGRLKDVAEDYEISELNTKIVPALKGFGAKFKDGSNGISERLLGVYASLGTEALGPALRELRQRIAENKLAATAGREIAAVVATGRAAAGARLAGMQKKPTDVKEQVLTAIASAQRHTVPPGVLAGRKFQSATKGQTLGPNQLIEISGSTASDVSDRIQSTAAGFDLDMQMQAASGLPSIVGKVGPASIEVRQRLDATAAELEEVLGHIIAAVPDKTSVETSMVEAVQRISSAAVAAGSQIQIIATKAAERIQIIAAQANNVTCGPRKSAQAAATQAFRHARPAIARASAQMQAAAVAAGQGLQTACAGKLGPVEAKLSIQRAAVQAGQQIQSTIDEAAVKFEDAARDSGIREKVQNFAAVAQKHLEVVADEALEVLGLERRQVPAAPEFQEDSSSRTPLTMLLIVLVVAVWVGVAVGRQRGLLVAPRWLVTPPRLVGNVASLQRWLSSWRRGAPTANLVEVVATPRPTAQVVSPRPYAKVASPRLSGVMPGIGGS